MTMPRHKWFYVEEDVRTSVLDARPQLWRCKKCGLYKTTKRNGYGTMRSWYGKPYVAGWVAHAPECKPVKGDHQWGAA